MEGLIINIKETDLFKRNSLLLLDRNKEQLDTLKEKLSLYANVKLDNSGLIRVMADYIFDHQELLHDMVSYVEKNKGFTIMDNFLELVRKKSSPQEISKKTGISVTHVRKLISGDEEKK